jgi:NAD-dependent DNA ligase
MSHRAKVAAEQQVQDRLIDELIGICRGVIADGHVDEREAIFLGQWIENHREIADRWPVNILYSRLVEMLKDGVLNPQEQMQLLETLRDLTGESTMYQEPNRSTSLPLNKPTPNIIFHGKNFVMAGRFVFGNDMDCEEAVLELGGSVGEAPGEDTDYLVIGEMCSPDWEHTTFGRKIEQAVELRESGSKLAIISEQDWVDALAAH